MIVICSTSRAEKVKCDKCEELEAVLGNEKKSNAQLKRQIELKDVNRKQAATATNAGPCEQCPTSKELLDQQKEENVEVMGQVMNQEERTKQERTAKEVRVFHVSYRHRWASLVFSSANGR